MGPSNLTKPELTLLTRTSPTSSTGPVNDGAPNDRSAPSPAKPWPLALMYSLPSVVLTMFRVPPKGATVLTNVPLAALPSPTPRALA